MKRSEKKRRRQLSVDAPKKRRVSATVVAGELEIARGHDGIVRGSPEPVVVLGLYSYAGGNLSLEAREILRFASPRKIPGSVAVLVPDPRPMRVRRSLGDGERFLLLLSAIEEDSGVDVATFFQSLESPQMISAFLTEASDPTPYLLRDLAAARNPELTDALRCSLLFDGSLMSQRCKGDDFIASSFLTFEVGESSRRARFVSENGLNDWTLAFDLRVA